MCELLAMSARFPTTLAVSMGELGRHGGGTGPHADGWGIGFVHENDAAIVREPLPAYTSEWLSFVQQQHPRSHIILAHIRLATQGPRLLRNTQPFARELGGRIHMFAHNGNIPEIADAARTTCRRFRPVGDTDSEQAFCLLIERLAPLWDEAAAAGTVPDLARRLDIVAELAAELRPHGPANFIYADTDAIFAHGHKRTSVRKTMEPPGLHVLCRRCTARSEGVAGEEPQQVALVASVPLTDEGWEPFAEGDVVVLREGAIVARRPMA